MTPREETLAFVEDLFGGIDEELWTLFWTLGAGSERPKRSHWSRVTVDAAELAQQIHGLIEGNDVYVSVSVAETNFGPTRRIGNAEAAGIMGLWADIDIADPEVHKKWNLPPDEESAHQLLADVGLPPSIVVHSGHGLQVWWLFDEFWRFENEEARLSAAQLAQSWNTTLRVRAAAKGWTIDSTFDLARVMRIPGTINRKGGEAAPVRLLERSPHRYSAEDFEEHMADETALGQLGLTPAVAYVVDDKITLDAAASPPFEKFQAMCDAEPTFQKSWDRTRTIRDMPDQSPSSYDLSLASLAVLGGWSDQEIADLIIASRRKHRDDLKLRLDYYRRTIAKAHESMDRVRGVEILDDVADDFTEARAIGDDDSVRETRRAVLDSVSKQLGVEIIRIIKFNSSPPSYRLVTPTGGVNVGSAQDMLSQNTMRAYIAAETAQLIPRFKTNEWDKLMKVVFQTAEEQDVGLESTEGGQIYVWLSDYIASRRPINDPDEAAVNQHPYIEDGQVHVFASQFRQWLWLNRGERVSTKDLGRMLRLFNCTPLTVKVHDDDGADTTRSVWRLPPRESWSTR